MHSQENLSFTAWRGLAGVPKACRKDDPPAQPSGIDPDEEMEDPDGSPFPAQCSSTVDVSPRSCHSTLPS